MVERGGAARARGVGRALGALSLLSGLVAGVIARAGAFHADDYWSLQDLRVMGVGWDFIGRPVFGHVTPGANLAVALVGTAGGGRYGWAVLEIVLLAAAVPPMAFAAARSLGARPVPALAAALVTATSVGWASASTWWSAALNVTPAALGGMAVLVGMRTHARGRWWGRWGAALGLLVALSVTEGAAVFVVLPLAVAWEEAGRTEAGRSVAVRARLLWADRRGWGVLALPLAAMWAWRASASAPVLPPPHPGIADLLVFPGSFLLQGFVPTWAGAAPGRAEPFGSPALAVVVGLAVGVATWAALRGRLRTGVGWSLGAVVATVWLRGVLVAWGRLEVLGWSRAVELRYLADLTWMAPVVLAGYLAPAPRRARTRRRVPATVAVTALAALGGLVGQLVVVVGDPGHEARRYRERMTASSGAVPPGGHVLDTAVPGTVLGPEFGAYLFLSRTVAPTGVPLRFGTTAPWYRADDRGVLRRVRLGPVSQLDPASAFTAVGAPGVVHRGGCWVAESGDALVWVPLTVPVARAAWVLDLRLTGTSWSELAIESAGLEPVTPIVASPGGRSRRRWVVTTLPFAAGQLGFRVPSGERLCLRGGTVDDVVVVR